MRLLLFLFLLLPSNINAQKHDYLWPLGLDSRFSPYRFFFDFNTEPPSILVRNDTVSNAAFSASWCTKEGQLVAYSNGLRILNTAGEQMENGFGLNPTQPETATAVSYNVPKSGFFLEKPGDPGTLYFIHLDFGPHPANDWPYEIIGHRLLVTTIDLEANGGLGKVTKKNEVLLEGLLQTAVAVRHGNGRDWWILLSDADENRHFRFLLTPEGFRGPGIQYIGNKPYPVGGLKLNPGSGSTISLSGELYLDLNAKMGFGVYHFDRCNGLLSNERRLNYVDPPEVDYLLGAGAEFSPNDRFLYVTCSKLDYTRQLFPSPVSQKPIMVQYDLHILGAIPTGDTINYLDSFKYYPYKVNYDYETLRGTTWGPDGKIYASYDDHAFSTVKYPNLKGKFCQFKYLNPDFKNIIYIGIPYFPNYRLGPLDGSPCDTLGLNNIPVANFRVDDSLGILGRYFYDLSYHEPTEWAWDFGDGSPIVRDTHALHLYAKAGQYEVCLTVRNAYGSNTYCRVVYAGVSPTAEATPVFAEDWQVFPNPAQDVAVLYFPQVPHASLLLRVTDALGHLISEQPIAGQWTELDVQQWAKGVYFLYIENLQGQVAVRKLVVGR